MKKIEIDRMTGPEVSFVRSIARDSDLEFWSEGALLAELERSDSICLVAKNKQTIIGFLVARLIMTENIIEIYNIGVERDFQRQGIASRLLKSLLKSEIANSSVRVFLEVRVSNTGAIGFYLKNGFSEVGRRKKFYSNPIEDAVIMNFTNDKEKKT